MKGPADIFRNARRIVDLRHPFGHLAEHPAVVDFLKGLAFHHPARHLTDQQHHRRRILEGDMDAGTCIGRAGTAGHHADTGPAGELAIGIGHHGRAAFLAAHHRADTVALLQAVDNRQIAFAGHTEDEIYPLLNQRIDKNMATETAMAGTVTRGRGAHLHNSYIVGISVYDDQLRSNSGSNFCL